MPENDKGVRTSQRIDIEEETRGKAREYAARRAYYFVLEKGLWINLADARIVPSLENSINQLQEMYQKKYLEERAEYTFKELPGDRSGDWNWPIEKTDERKEILYKNTLIYRQSLR